MQKWNARGAEDGSDRAKALPSASAEPLGQHHPPARRPAPGQANPKRQDEGLYNGSP